MDYVFNREKGAFNIGTITCVGHSLGGALALLAAYDLAQEAIVPRNVKIRLRSYEAPKVGEYTSLAISESGRFFPNILILVPCCNCISSLQPLFTM